MNNTYEGIDWPNMQMDKVEPPTYKRLYKRSKVFRMRDLIN